MSLNGWIGENEMSRNVNDFEINKEFNNKMQEAAYLYAKQKYEKEDVSKSFTNELTGSNKKRYRNRLMRTAAILILVILTGMSSVIWVNDDGVHGGKQVLSKCISIISPLDMETEVDDDGNVAQIIKISEESDIKELKKHIKEVRGVEYIPDNYSFESLTVRKYADSTFLEYMYTNPVDKSIILVFFDYYDYDPDVIVMGELFTSENTGQTMYVAELPETDEFIVTEITDTYDCVISGKGDKDIGIRMIESIHEY